MSDKPQPRSKKVVEGKVIRRKKKTTPIGDSFDRALAHATSEIIIPTAKEMLADAMNAVINSLLFPNGGGQPRTSRRTRITGGRRETSGVYTAYNRISSVPASEPYRPVSKTRVLSGGNHDFGQLVFQSRPEAKAVLDEMYNVLNTYDVVTVSDLLSSVGEKSNHTDQKWGWYDLRGSVIQRTGRGDFVLDLPDTEYIE